MTSLHTSNLNNWVRGRFAAPSNWIRGGLILWASIQSWSVSADVGIVDSPPVYTSWQTFTMADGLPSNAIRTFQAYGNRLWVGTDDGLAVLENQKWRSWTTKDGLPARRIQCLDVDPRTNDLWIGTLGGGLVRLTAGRFDVFNQFNSGLAGDFVFAITIGNGRVWAATNGGISAYDLLADDWELLAERRADAPFFVATALACEGGDLYADFRRIGVRRWDAGAGRWASGELRDRVHALQSSIGCLFAMDDGLRFPTDAVGGTYVLYRRSGGGPGGQIALVRNGSVIDTRVTSDSIPDNRVRCVQMHNDAIWVGTANGLARGADPVAWKDLPRVKSPPPTSSPGSSWPSRHEDDATAWHSSSQPAIGVLGPRTRRIALPGDEQPSRKAEPFPDLLAVQLAVESVNTRGGFRGAVPYQIATAMFGYANYGWSLPEDDFIIFADNPDLLGLVAYAAPDQAITDTAVALFELPVVSSAPYLKNIGSEDSRNPWLFTCRGDEPARHRLLLDHLVKSRNCTRLAIITTGGESSRPPACWWSKYARILGLPAPVELSWEPAKPEPIEETVKALRASDAQAILTWGDARDALTLLRGIRAAGLRQLLVAGPDIASDHSFADFGSDAGEVITMMAVTSAPVYPDGPHARPQRSPASPDRLPTDTAAEAKGSIGSVGGPVVPEIPNSPIAQFTRKYVSQSARGWDRTGLSANVMRTFDATDHLLAAVNLAGTDRNDLRRILAVMEESPLGEEHFERAHGAGDVVIAELKEGRWVYRTVTVQGPITEPAAADGSH